jgi:hypothetical protein
MVLAAIAAVGLAYLAIARPQRFKPVATGNGVQRR